jgi:hypothetical protein
MSTRTKLQPIRISLSDTRTLADELWHGATEVGAQWSARKANIEKLHTLVYQLVADIAGHHGRTVYVDISLTEAQLQHVIEQRAATDGRLAINRSVDGWGRSSVAPAATDASERQAA